MGNLECNLGHIFAGCCSKDEEIDEEANASKKGNVNSYAELKRTEAGGDVFDGGNIKGNTAPVTIINSNNQGFSAGQMVVKGDVNYGSQPTASSNGYQQVPDSNYRNDSTLAITEN